MPNVEDRLAVLCTTSTPPLTQGNNKVLRDAYERYSFRTHTCFLPSAHEAAQRPFLFSCLLITGFAVGYKELKEAKNS